MSIEWMRLVDLRERHQQAACERVARDRRSAEESQAQAQAAQARLQEQIGVKASHWQAIANALQGGGCDVARLRDAGAWSRALDGHIARADSGVAQAQAVAAERQGALEASRQQLNRALAATERARQMAKRATQEQQRVRDLRIDDATEEASSLAWVRRRAL